MTEGIDVREFLGGYLAESEELLSAADANLLALDQALKKGDNHPRAVRELFRGLHTIKGISAMIGAEPIVDIAHEMESVLKAADQSGVRLPVAAIEVLLRGLRAIEDRVGKLSRDEPLETPKPLLAELAGLRVPAAVAPATSGELDIPADLAPRLSPGEREQLAQGVRGGARLVRVDFVPSAENVAAGTTITTVRQRLSALGELVKVVPLSRPSAGDGQATILFSLLLLTARADADLVAAARVAPESLTALGPRVPAPAPGAPEATSVDELGQGPDPARSSHVRVDLRRLDETLERLSALVVVHARLQALTAGGDREVRAAVAEGSRRLRDLRSAVMRARMVPASDLIERAPLLVRGLASSTGKKVEVSTEVSPVELDKAVVDRLFPVLVHLLRNAVDHAIESPEERRRLGKPEIGALRVTCTPSADAFLEVTVADDGRGIDGAKVAARAGVEAPRTDEALLALLVRPGFSTLDVATAVSGRGFGMDIVQRGIAELGGELELRTAVGRGTTFTLRVPLSITIVDVLTFRCAERMFVVPVRAVERLADAGSLPSMSPPGPDSRAVRLSSDGGRALPLYDLAALLGVHRAAPERSQVIIVKRGEERFGFEVDRMVGRKEVVMRPVIDPLVQAPGVTGTADLGDGKPTLVLDLLGLVRGAARAAGEARS